MGLTDMVLARRHITLPSAPPLEECRRRIGPDTQYSGVSPVDLDDANPIVITWLGDDEVRAQLPRRPHLGRSAPLRAELRAHFIPQGDGTDVGITTGFMAFQVLNYAGLWALLLFFAVVGSLASSGGSRNELFLAIAVFLMPVIYLVNRGSIARQGAQILTNFENLLETPAFTSPAV